MHKFELNSIVKGFSGILFIGDIHGSSSRPGRRVDDYPATCVDKIRQCAVIAKQQNLFPVCLGDFFHRSKENNVAFISMLMEVCSEFEVPLIVLSGSHDLTETRLSKYDGLNILHRGGFVHVVDRPGRIVTLDINGELVSIWGTPAGDFIPDEIDGSGSDVNLMITHHNIDFYGGLPEFIIPKEIKGCSMVVNGHLHHPAPMVLAGSTAYHNPGSITRVEVTMKKIKPVVSAWTPAHGINLEAIPLVIRENVFDLTGTEVYAADPSALKAATKPTLSLSKFAERVRSGGSAFEAQATDDGSITAAAVDNYLTMFDKPAPLRNYMTTLLTEAVKNRTGVEL